MELVQTRSHKMKNFVYDALGILTGSILMGFSVQYFAAPNNISIGGITGIATMLNFVTDGRFPIGLTALALNVPLFILAAFLLGRSLFVKTLIGTLLSSAFMDLFGWLFTRFDVAPYTSDVLIAAIFGGVIGGIGLGLIFLRGGTTGGVDIISRLVKLKLPYMEIGKLLMIIEGIILIFTTIVYKNISCALYSIITIYLYSKFVDTVLYGIDTGKSYLIISDKNREISAAIIQQLGRGVTLLKGSGAYTDTEKEVILTAVRNNETAKVREIVKAIDPGAFMIVFCTTETIGYGFKSIKENK